MIFFLSNKLTRMLSAADRESILTEAQENSRVGKKLLKISGYRPTRSLILIDLYVVSKTFGIIYI